MASTRSRIKHLQLAAGATTLGVLMAMACSGTGGDGGSSVAEGDASTAAVTLNALPDGIVQRARILRGNTEAMGHLDGTAGAALRVHGDQLLRHTAADGQPARLDVGMAVRADAALEIFPIHNSDSFVTFTPRGATDALGHVDDDGRVLYKDAYRATDVIRTLDATDLNQTFVINDRSAPRTFRWTMETAEGLRVVPTSEDGYVLVNDKNIPQLGISAVEIVDAEGQSTTGRLLINEDAQQATLRVDTAQLALPVVVNWGVTVTVSANAVTTSIVKGRVMVILDTSGSMLLNFGGGTHTHGDGPETGSVFCGGDMADVTGTTPSFRCEDNVECTAANGVEAYPVPSESDPSRMFGAKEALANVINAHSGLLDFGLTRYIENSSASACPNETYCCDPAADNDDRGRCNTADGGSWEYEDYFDTDSDGLTYSGGCGTVDGGARVLVLPQSTDSSLNVLPWVDHVEDFCAEVGDPDVPRNPEIRANGSTPLGRSVITARTDWYQPIYDISQDPGNSADPDYDELIDCRSYALVVMTDGIESCEDGDPDCNSDSDCISNDCPQQGGTDYCTCTDDSQCNADLGCWNGECVNLDERPLAVSHLVAVNSTNPVKVYPLGMGNESGLDVDELDAMAVAGGTGPTAPVATSQSEIEAAFADIVADSAKYEICNDLDDNCNTFIDEGLQVLESCDPEGVNTCSGGQTCDATGRCPCTGGAGQCNVGYTCDALDGNGGVCRNSCTVDVFACSAAGVRKCGSDGAATCCEIDGASVCTELADPTGEPETCDNPGVDDDCNGLIDDGTDCAGCLDIEICNGSDDDCDVAIDESPLFQLSDLCDDAGDCNGGACIDGECGCGSDAQCEAGYKCSSSNVCRPECGTDEGVCTLGYTICDTGGTDAPACVDNYAGTTEICDGLDNDCDGYIDEGVSDPNVGLSQNCYSYGTGTGDATVGVGICQLGSQVCTAVVGSGVPAWGTCDGEVNPAGSDPCDGLDNNCNGQIDEGHGVFDTCTVDGDCGANCNAGRCDCGSDSDCANGFECSFGLCHSVCSIGTDACQTDGVNKCDNGSAECCLANFDICSVATAGTPTTEICDGINNDCDGQIDEIDGTCCPLGCTGDGSGGDPYVGVGACSPGGYI
ncbi:MAG: hypothetical protein HRU17_14500, partial [Polyangiaceae bacterium]|nr:hypothetical protein [Polyangiaceae bacterium]